MSNVSDTSYQLQIIYKKDIDKSPESALKVRYWSAVSHHVNESAKNPHGGSEDHEV